MKIFICPMHPEVERDKPGRCPKCGMRLIAKSELKDQHQDPLTGNYTPLVVIIALILLTSITTGGFNIEKTISHFMIGFFIVFSGFKLMDLKGFAEGYSTYDLLAQKWFNYGYIYPFIELFFGLAMILFGDVNWLLLTEIIIMTFSGLGVAIKLLKREKFQCSCLGTFLKVPLTKITIIEDFGMAALALLMLLI